VPNQARHDDLQRPFKLPSNRVNLAMEAAGGESIAACAAAGVPPPARAVAARAAAPA